jgi:multicomponent Na+:H+ antiporter subunit B
MYGSLTRTTTVLLAIGGKAFLSSGVLRDIAVSNHRHTARLLPLLFMFSQFLLGRGHNDPGGGFVAGLVAGAAWIQDALATDTAQARRALHVQLQSLIGWRGLAAQTSGWIGLVLGQPFLTGQWIRLELPGFGAFDLGTPLLLDLGVDLAVLGVTATIVFALAEA